MNRLEIIRQAMLKLSAIDKEILQRAVKELKSIYVAHKNDSFESNLLPKSILKYIGNLMDNYDLNQKDRILFLDEVRKNNLFDFGINQNLEKAWRVILKKWSIPNYNFQGGSLQILH